MRLKREQPRAWREGRNAKTKTRDPHIIFQNTKQGLSVGFVLLRVEAYAEENEA